MESGNVILANCGRRGWLLKRSVGIREGEEQGDGALPGDRPLSSGGVREERSAKRRKGGEGKVQVVGRKVCVIKKSCYSRRAYWQPACWKQNSTAPAPQLVMFSKELHQKLGPQVHLSCPSSEVRRRAGAAPKPP